MFWSRRPTCCNGVPWGQALAALVVVADVFALGSAGAGGAGAGGAGACAGAGGAGAVIDVLE